ncbi:MAG TPA: hypothetical protein VF844_20305, partial [Ktedonobacteraceae bacterium]
SRQNTFINLLIKCGAISFLLLLSILIVACSGNGSSQVDPGTPVATVTINLGQVIGSPTPPLKEYYCGGWAPDTSPPFSSTSSVSVFGKVTHTVTVEGNSNPEGVKDATAAAIIQWPDGTTDKMSVTTTSDGLAVFSVAIKASAINKLVTIMISFTSQQGVLLCTIPSAAYFTAIMVSPTPTNTAVPSPTGTPSVTPTGSPIGTGTPTGTPVFTPTPTPTKGH